MKYPPPDFVVEVLSPSTARNDRGVKFVDYAANGVAEYWIVDPKLESIEQYVLQADRYERAGIFSCDQEITSTQITNLTIPVRAVFAEDRQFEALRKLIND